MLAFFRLSIFIFLISIYGNAISADMFTVDGIKVSSSSSNAKQAKDNAIAAGQKEAFAKLLERITSAPSNLANIDSAKLSELVQSMEVNDEKITSTFYSATLSISFNRAMVDKLLKEGNVSYTDKKSPPIVILPLLNEVGGSLLFEDTNPLKTSLAGAANANHVLSIIIPSNGPDKSSLSQDIENISATAKDTILSLGKEYNADKLILISANRDADKLNIKMRDFKDPQGTIKEISIKDADLPNGENIYNYAAKNIVSYLEGQWLKGKSSAANTKITLTVPFSSLEEWVSIRKRLENLGFLKTITVSSLTVKYALVDISFADNFESLTAKMNENGLLLENTGSAIILRAN